MRVSNFRYPLEAWVRVDHDSVRRVAVRSEEFLLVRGPLEGRDLGGSDERMKTCTCGSIPDMYCGIVGAAP